MGDEADRTNQQPKLISYIIAPPVRQAMAKGGPIQVIINLVESREKPEEGVGPAKEAVKSFILGLKYNTHLRESDFYVFATLQPEDIQILSTKPEVYQIWLDERCEAHILQSCEAIK